MHAVQSGYLCTAAPLPSLNFSLGLPPLLLTRGRVEVPPAEPSGVQPVLVSLPHFNETAQYDAIATIAGRCWAALFCCSAAWPVEGG